MAKRRAVRRFDHPWDLSAGKGRFAVALLLICLCPAPAAALVAISARQSPLNAFSVDGKARPARYSERCFGGIPFQPLTTFADL